MKRLILIAAFILTAGTLAAQNYIIVNSEKVFKSIDAYNTAISDLDSSPSSTRTRWTPSLPKSRRFTTIT